MANGDCLEEIRVLSSPVRCTSQKSFKFRWNKSGMSNVIYENGDSIHGYPDFVNKLFKEHFILENNLSIIIIIFLIIILAIVPREYSSEQ